MCVKVGRLMIENKHGNGIHIKLNNPGDEEKANALIRQIEALGEFKGGQVFIKFK